MAADLREGAQRAQPVHARPTLARKRAGGAQFSSEFVATFGLLAVIERASASRAVRIAELAVKKIAPLLRWLLKLTPRLRSWLANTLGGRRLAPESLATIRASPELARLPKLIAALGEPTQDD